VSRWAAILSGGVGERFWPASTPARPKQLLPLLGTRSMLRETLDRLPPLVPPARTLIVTSAGIAEAVRREAPELDAANVLAEPRGRNTAAAIGVAAAAAALREGRDAALAVLPADHAVADAAALRSALDRAFEVAESAPRIVTLGIRPDRPETGYGYITAGERLGGGGGPVAAASAGSELPAAAADTRVGAGVGAFSIAAFHEKPPRAEAERLVASGRSWWNAGMFVARAGTLLDEIARAEPELGALLDALLEPGRWDTAFAAVYEKAPSISFDHAVMERTAAGAVLPVDLAWDDVGSWEAVARLVGADASGNVVRGTGRLRDAGDNILYSEGGRITVIGASGLLVVRAGEETFVCARERLPEVRELLRSLEAPA
jgi:mannose-1-phosphate guanylyltransferase